MTEPIFLLSTPRAGSTLLQRILSIHSEISTTPEPCVLLPTLYGFKKNGVFAHYHQAHIVRGLTEFCDCLPEKKITFATEFRAFVESLYQKAADNNRYFLDKSPGYTLIAPEVLEIFPEAKIVVLVRNPVASVSSAIELWGLGKWRLFLVHDAMARGLKILLKAVAKNKGRICLVNFERLTADPEQEVRRITDYLDIEFEAEMISGFTKVSFKGKMGDPNADNYSEISTDPHGKYKKVMNTPLRKLWVKKYLNYLGAENLERVGYKPDLILKEISQLKNDHVKCLQDLFEMSRDTLKIRMKELVFKRTAHWQ